MNKWYIHTLLALLSGILLSAAWPANGFPFLTLIAFIPLLWIEDQLSCSDVKRKGWKLLGHTYLAFFVWNLFTTYWIYFSSPEGAYVAILLNAFLMACIWVLFQKTKRVLGTQRGYIGLITYWLAFEFLHFDWDLSWPWLHLGNAFANYPQTVQWYEYTGALGGSLWVLISNILAYRVLKNILSKKAYILIGVSWFLLIIIPIIFSLLRYANYVEDKKPIRIVLVQPNIDPWDKFGGISPGQQFENILQLALSKIDSTTDYLITPETSIFPYGVWDHELIYSQEYLRLKELTNKYPNLHIIAGISHLQVYEPGPDVPSTAEKFRNKDLYYDDHNSAIQIDRRAGFQIYHKSKLVPGPEMMPFAEVLKPIQHKLFGKMGGQIGDMGTQKERTVFSGTKENLKAAPVICYESIYGEFVSEYARNGATFISVSTNDAWWGDSPGYKQLLAYTRLRAIETRRSIARSANTGISCFINQRGDVLQPTKFWTADAVSGTINANDALTFYTRHGDYLGRLSVLFGIMLIVFTYIRGFLRKKKFR